MEEEDGIPYSKWCQNSLVAPLEKIFSNHKTKVMVFWYSHCRDTGIPDPVFYNMLARSASIFFHGYNLVLYDFEIDF